MTDLEYLQHLIDHYDWYYEMSDSFTVWQVGVENDRKIEALAQKVGFFKYSNMWTKAVNEAAKMYRDPEEFKQRYLTRLDK